MWLALVLEALACAVRHSCIKQEWGDVIPPKKPCHLRGRSWHGLCVAMGFCIGGVVPALIGYAAHGRGAKALCEEAKTPCA